ncbi:NAD-dependent epimerase/dehydratase family protein [Streptomyces sp. NPDC058872]|uniref:NAD-dependent epimerase/dehydratase family protein n=1 Tax=Streptomyces sp. NPDC058872 TaxID=3346661 RepID=UPI0036A36328
MGPRLLITGATGFIGSRVAALAALAPEPAHVRLLARRPVVPSEALATAAEEGVRAVDRPTVEAVPGDLRDAEALRRACAGIDVLVHCASAVGAGEEVSRAVNDEGTRALVDAALEAGATRIVALSTASVHGRGPFRAAKPGSLPLAPGSTTSRTRAAGERHVVDAGGTALRPHLVYGTGDRQVVPGIARLLAALPGPLDGGSSLHSMIDVEALARAVLGAALAPTVQPGPHYVGHPEPVPVTELIAAVEGLVGGAAERPRDRAVDIAGARDLLAGLPFAGHHLDMLAVDHWFADERPWQDWGCDPGPGFGAGFADHLPWYRKLLGDTP